MSRLIVFESRYEMSEARAKPNKKNIEVLCKSIPMDLRFIEFNRFVDLVDLSK